jgi:type I restriction enzyme S subunit
VLNSVKLGDYIALSELKNTEKLYGLDSLKGISIQKIFIDTKADMDGVSLSPYLIVSPDYFAYVSVTSRNGGKITIAHNDTKDTYIVSSSYSVFYVREPEALLSDYLFMYFNRPEFDRYMQGLIHGARREKHFLGTICAISESSYRLFRFNESMPMYSRRLAAVTLIEVSLGASARY